LIVFSGIFFIGTTLTQGLFWCQPQSLEIVPRTFPIVADSSTATGLKWAVDPVADVVTTAGDLIYATAADTVTRLGIGTAGQVLKVNSGATAPEWAAAAAGGAYTLLNSGGTALSGATVTISSISGDYTDLYLILEDFQFSGSANIQIRFNNDSGNNYYQSGTYVDGSGSSGFKGNAEATGLDIGNDGSSGNQQNVGVIRIFNYTDTSSNRVGQINYFMKVSSNSFLTNVGFGYKSTTAITRIDLIVGNSQTFNGGTYYLYGVK